MLSKKQEFLLQKVQKPARYIGGEVNSVVKDKSKIKFRYAFCFPDNYEIGMSHLGMKYFTALLMNAKMHGVSESLLLGWIWKRR